jgi:hypothetical protein
MENKHNDTELPREGGKNPSLFLSSKKYDKRHYYMPLEKA